MRMKNETILKWCAFALAVVLAAMGCWFCWSCPMEWLYGEGQHMMFERQVVWNAVGLAFFAGAASLRWKWWLKSAPWLVVLWAALAFYALEFCYPVNGAHRWVTLGPLRLTVRTLLILVSALFAAWLCSKKFVKPWMIVLVLTVVGCYFVWRFLHGTNLMEYLSGTCPPHERIRGFYMSRQMRAAFCATQWLSATDLSLRYLPNPANDSMASASAILFGRWFPIAVSVLIAALGATLTSLWRRIKKPSSRIFFLFWGVGMLFPAFYSLFQCVGFLPPRGASPVLIGYGGTGVLVFWIGLGVVFSMLREKEADSPSRIFQAGNWVVWSAVTILYAYGVLSASHCGLHFDEPPPRADDIGEFGTCAKRGVILAANGSVLARSYAATRIHLDPKSAKMKAWESPEECYETVARTLGLSAEFVSKQYARTGSRFIKLVDEATPEMVSECMNLRLFRRSGLVLHREQRREYPFGSNAVQIVGCTLRSDCEEKTWGCAGLEYTYNSVLQGRNSVLEWEMTLREKIEKGRPVNGGTVVTTIDPDVQIAVSDALCAAAARTGAETGWGVVLKVPTGEIAAMASVPTYRPSERKSNDSRYMNHAAQSLFEPGGLMKPITYAMAMDIGLITPKTEIDHGNGVWEYAQTNYHDSCTGVLTVAESLIRRSNIAAGKVGVMLWPDRFVRELPRFGIGRKVGGGTLYGEEIGILYRRNRYDPVSISRLGMGRCTAVTGIQMANAYAIFANDGVEVLPHLVSRTTDADGKVDFQFLPLISTNRVIEVETAQKMRGMMEDAFKAIASEPGVDFGGVRVAGAVTETPLPEGGIYSPTNFNVAVIGCLPAEKPEYVVAVGFQKPKGDHSVECVALPAFAEVVRKLKKGE